MELFKRIFGYQREEPNKERTLNNWKEGIETGYVHYFYLANSFYQQNMFEEAYNCIEKAIELADVSDWQMFALKANILEGWENYADAISVYTKGIEVATSDLRIYALYHQIGFCYLSLGNDRKAEEFYTIAIELKKKHPNSEFFEDLEGFDGGIVRGLPFERLYNNRGNARKNLGKLKEALDDCQTASHYNPSYSNPYLLAGQVFELANQKETALSMYFQAAKLGNSYAQNMLKRAGYL